MNSYETIRKALQNICADGISFSLDKPDEVTHGDYATNIAFPLSKAQSMSPKEYAEIIVPKLQESLSELVEKIEVAGPGFINFFLKDDMRTDEAEFFSKDITFLVKEHGSVIVEYTDPNPFKIFHIGHLVPNTIGESIARLYESQGKHVTRICYQGDVGVHVAKAIYAILKNFEVVPKESASLREKVTYLGRAYAFGNSALESDETIKKEIVTINKAIFAKSDEHINALYEEGKKWSLDYFETIYEKLGTKFDNYIFESEVGDEGKAIVKKYIGTVFEESDGALVYKGEKVGLHTRVFVNKEDLPTYEAKELGNTYKKKSLVPEAEESIVVTANEIDEYFKVIKAALSEIDKPLADSIMHISHGMLRLPEGKMSSRTGNIIPAEELIDLVKSRILEKIERMRVEGDEQTALINDIAVGAIKFAILKSAPGKDMIFDFDKSLSFEGDSGPYLQYTHARISALLDKAKNLGIVPQHGYVVENPERELEQVITKYSLVLDKAFKEIGPHHIIQYLLSLTRAYNSVYGRVQIVDENNKDKSLYYLMLSLATKNILSNGLHILGIKAPERM
jgi:arginyl-tRNA synthetase